MKEIVYSHSTSKDKSVREFLFEENSKRNKINARKIKKCKYKIQPQDGSKSTRDVVSDLAILQGINPTALKNLQVKRVCNSQTNEETVYLEATGIFFVDYKERLYRIEYEKTIEVFLTPIVNEQEEKKQETSEK